MTTRTKNAKQEAMAAPTKRAIWFGAVALLLYFEFRIRKPIMSKFATLEEAGAAEDGAIEKLANAVENAISSEKEDIKAEIAAQFNKIGDNIAAGQSAQEQSATIEAAKNAASARVDKLDELTASLVTGIKGLAPEPATQTPAPDAPPVVTATPSDAPVVTAPVNVVATPSEAPAPIADVPTTTPSA